MRSPRPGRRLLLALLALPVLFVVYLYFVSHSGLLALVDTRATEALPDEIFGLLHFVTSPDEDGRVLDVAPDKPVQMAWYARGAARGGHPAQRAGDAQGWATRLAVLRDQHPLVVFSKTYCPYSKRAKKLLEMYALEPAPSIVEVDLRADVAEMKTVLTRLTGRTTFPNVILHGQSLGGSDDLARLHGEGQLRQVLEQGGVKVGWTAEGNETILI